MALTKVIGNGLGAVTQDGAATFNEGSADVDFRVESNGNANMINVDGGNDRVGLGIAPSFNVQIDKSSTNTTLTDLTDAQLVLSNTGSATTNQHVKLGFRFQDGSVNGQSMIAAVRESGSSRASSLRFYTGPASDGDPEEAVSINSTGAVSMPLQPAFSAKATNDQTNIAVNSNVTLVLDSERFDQNADFASNTFTAPVTGKYQLQTVVYFQNLDSASTVYNVKITTSNTDYQAPFDPDFGQDNGYWGWGFSILADMDANDTAYVFVRQTGGTQQTDLANASYFSGYLVC